MFAPFGNENYKFHSPFYGLLYTTLPQLTYLKRTDEAFIKKQMKPNPVGGEEAGEGALTALGKVIYCIICACLRTTTTGGRPCLGTSLRCFTTRCLVLITCLLTTTAAVPFLPLTLWTYLSILIPILASLTFPLLYRIMSPLGLPHHDLL